MFATFCDSMERLLFEEKKSLNYHSEKEKDEEIKAHTENEKQLPPWPKGAQHGLHGAGTFHDVVLNEIGRSPNSDRRPRQNPRVHVTSMSTL